MKGFSKWLSIVWSIFCLIGVFVGMVNVSNLPTSNDQYAEAGTAIGTGCGFGIWLVIWLVVAGPAIIIYFVSGKPDTVLNINNNIVQNSELCIECGKYYTGKPKFCPHCGKKTIFK